MYYPPDQQGPYGQMYDYNGDGAVDQFDFQFAQAMALLYPNRVFTAYDQGAGFIYDQWFEDTFARPLDDPDEIERPSSPSDVRMMRTKPNFASKRKGQKQQQQGTGGPGGFPPFGGPAKPGRGT